ncbi:hypothetical protein [Symbiopectobacterium sp. RP]
MSKKIHSASLHQFHAPFAYLLQPRAYGSRLDRRFLPVPVEHSFINSTTK